MVGRWLRQIGELGAASVDELFARPEQEALAQAQDQGWRIDQPGEYCPRCGASVGPHAAMPGGCALCVDRPIAWQGITRLSAYRVPVDGWVRAMKFRGQWSWVRLWGDLLAQMMPPAPAGLRTAVTAVPMHWLRCWNRGYNQSQLLAAEVARSRGWPLVNLLRRSRYTPPQTSVAPSQRPANINGSFTVRRVDLADWRIILVDDVKTTGATLGACARLLKRAGAHSVHAAVIAVADPQGRDFARLPVQKRHAGVVAERQAVSRA